MNIDKQEFLSQASRAGLARQKETLQATRQAMHLAAECEKLVGLDSWDAYRRVLQGHYDTFRRITGEHLAKLLDPALVNRDDIMHCKMHHAMAEATASVFKFCLELPLTLIGEHAEVAGKAAEIAAEIERIEKLLDTQKKAIPE